MMETAQKARTALHDLSQARVEELSRDPGRFRTPPPSTCASVEPDTEARAEETLNLWIASRRTEFADGTIPRWELLGVSVHG
jgi:hypothetical protein